MKHVFRTDEVPHLWAHQKQSDARNSQGNLYFRDSTLYSYRDSYPIARHVTGKRGERAVLIRLDKYSVTTAKHISMAQRASSHLTRFVVANVAQDNSADMNLKDYAKRIETLEALTARSRQNAEWRMAELERLIAEANHYAQFVGIRHTFATCANMEELKERVKGAAARHVAETKKAEAKEKRERARKLAEAWPIVEAWKRGESVQFPYIVTDVYMRVEGDEVVTSKGARFPVAHARLGLALVRRCVEQKQEYHRNGHTQHLGAFAIDSIAPDGTVTAGCHVVRYAEIERLAPMLSEANEVRRMLGETPENRGRV